MKPLCEFNKNKAKPDGLSTYCTLCQRMAALVSSRLHKETQKEYYLANKEKTKIPRREANWRAHGIKMTEIEYTECFRRQGGQCAICKRTYTVRLAVDHDHVTGKVRGLLCGNCNRALGYFKDNVEVIQKAVEYVELGEKNYANC